MREEYRMHEEMAARRNKKREVPPVPIAAVARYLDQFEGGDVSAWCNASRDLTVKEDWPYGDEYAFDLTSEPGWALLGDRDRDRMVAAAEMYLLRGEPSNEAWFGKRVLHPPAAAGYRALHLIRSCAPARLDRLPAEVWAKWAAAAVSFPVFGSGDEQPRHQAMVASVYSRAPEEAADALIGLIRAEDAGRKQSHVIYAAEEMWDDGFGAKILDLVVGGSLMPVNEFLLLDEMLSAKRHGMQAAKAGALAYVTGRFEAAIDCGDDDAAISYGVVLLDQGVATWPTVWGVMQSNEEFGKALMERVAVQDRHAGRLFAEMAPDQLADVYLWLTERYPHSTDPHVEGAHTPSVREEVATLREAALRIIQGRGTPVGCAAIERLSAELPHLTWLKAVLSQSRELLRRNAWTPPSPAAVLRLAADANARIVQSGDHLLDLVVASLGRLQMELRGKSPDTEVLWDRMPDKRHFRPKGEQAFSRYVEKHLVRDIGGWRVTVNREVEIRPRQGSRPGENIDIYVDAILPAEAGATADVVTVIIESKGSWNRDVDTALNDQLVGRYLKDNACRHGVYLVGWFASDSWDPDHRVKPPSETIADARARFEEQARTASVGTLSVRAVVLDVSL
jgi:hypothetical protein